MLKNIIKRFNTFISKRCHINYIKLFNEIVADPSTYIRNLTTTKFSYVFDIETYRCKEPKTLTGIIDKEMPTSISIFHNGENVWTYESAEAQLLILLLREYIND